MNLRNLLLSLFAVCLLFSWCRVFSVCYPSFINGRCYLTIKNDFLCRLLVASSVGRRKRNPEAVRRRIGLLGLLHYGILIPYALCLWAAEGIFTFGIRAKPIPMSRADFWFCIIWLTLFVVSTVDLMVGEALKNRQNRK